MNDTVVGQLDAVTLFKKKVLIVSPWYKTVTAPTAYSVAQLRDRRRTSTFLNYGDAFIVHMRNRAGDLFLKSECEYMLTIDDDMVVPFGNAEWFNGHTGFNLPEPFSKFNALDRLMSHGRTLVGALYWGRHKNSKPVFNEGAQKAVADYVAAGPRDELLPTKWVGTGCMLIHRSVFEDIEKKFPNLARGADKMNGQWFSPSEHQLISDVDNTLKMLSVGPMDGEKAIKAYELLTAARNEARKISSLGTGEDVIFCRRARQCGHQPYVDLGLRAGHVGAWVF